MTDKSIDEIDAEIGRQTSKRASIYGTYKDKVPVVQRYWKKVHQRVWKKRRDGVKQRYWKRISRRYWKTTKRMKTVVKPGRFEFHGRGKDIRKAVGKSWRGFVPKGFVRVDADEFLENPEEYGFEGEWVDKEVKS